MVGSRKQQDKVLEELSPFFSTPLGYTPRGRYDLARARAVELGGPTAVRIDSHAPPLARIEQLAKNFDNGLYGIRTESFFDEVPFSIKTGPFHKQTTKGDLRILRSRLYETMPIETLYAGHKQPLPITGLQAANTSSRLFTFLTLDTILAQGFSEELAAVMHVKRNKKSDVLSVELPGDMHLRFYGKPSEKQLNIIATGIPSVSDDEKTYTINVLSETTRMGRAAPMGSLFSIQSTLAPWKTTSRTRQRSWGGRFLRERATAVSDDENKKQGLYTQEITVALLADIVMRTEYGYELNHPFHRFSPQFRQMATNLLESGIVVHADGTYTKPTKTYIEPLLNWYIAARRGSEFEQEHHEPFTPEGIGKALRMRK